MKTTAAFNVSSFQACKHTNQMAKLEFDVNAGAAATVYVQVHDFPTPADLAAGNVAPANGAVPLKSWPVLSGATNGYKEFKNEEMSFKYGAFICVSTVQATLTLGTVNNKFDSVAVELVNEEITGTTEVQISNNDVFQVWSEAAGVGKGFNLIRIMAVNNAAAVQYLLLYATDAAAGVPIKQWALQPSGDANGLDKLALDFDGGKLSMSGINVVMQTSAYVVKTGCTFVASSSASSSVPVGPFNFYAEYK